MTVLFPLSTYQVSAKKYILKERLTVLVRGRFFTTAHCAL